MMYWTVLASPAFDFEFERGFVKREPTTQGASYRGAGWGAWSNVLYLACESDTRLQTKIFQFNGIPVVEEQELSCFTAATVAKEFEELCWIQERGAKSSENSFGIDVCHPAIGSLISNFICNHSADDIEGIPNNNLLFDNAQQATNFVEQYYRLSRIEEVEPITDARPVVFVEIGSQNSILSKFGRV